MSDLCFRFAPILPHKKISSPRLFASSCSDLRDKMSRRPGKEKEENEEEAMTTIQTTKSGATDLSPVAETNNLRKKLGLAPLKWIQIRKTTKMMMRTA